MGARHLTHHGQDAESPVREGWLPRLGRFLFYLWAPVLVLCFLPFLNDPFTQPKLLATALLAIAVSIPVPGGRSGAGLTVPGVMALCLAWQTVSALASPHAVAGLVAVAPFAVWTLAAAGAAALFTDAGKAKRLCAVFAAALAVASLYGFAQGLGWDFVDWARTDIEEYRGLPATFGNPNFAGHALIFGVLFSLWLIFEKGCRWAAAPLLLCGAHLWLTGMRGGQLALAAAAVVFVAWLAAGRLAATAGRRTALALLLAGVLALLGAAAVTGVYHARHGLWLPSDSSLILRYNGYHGAAQMALDHPVTGVGPGHFDLLSPSYWTEYEQRWYALKNLKNDHVHCEPLEAAAETGLPGLFLFFLLLALPLLRAFRLAHDGPDPAVRRFGLMAAIAIVAAGVDGLFGFNLHVPVSAGICYVLLAVVDSVARNAFTARPAAVNCGCFKPAAPFRLLLAAACAGVFFLFFVADIQMMLARGRMERLGTARDEVLKDRKLPGWLDDAANKYPWKADFFWMRARLAMETGDFTTAEQAAAGAVARNPGRPEWHALLARALHGQALERHLKGRNEGVWFLLKRAEAAALRGAALCPGHSAPMDALWRIDALRAELTGDAAGRDLYIRRFTGHATTALAGGLEETAPLHAAWTRMALLGYDTALAGNHLALVLENDPVSREGWALMEEWEEAGGTEAPDYARIIGTAYAQLRRDAQSHPWAYFEAARRMARHYGVANPFPEAAQAVAAEAVTLFPSELAVWGLFGLTSPNMDKTMLLPQQAAALNVKLPESVEMLLHDPENPKLYELLTRELAFLEDVPEAQKKKAVAPYTWLVPLLKDQLFKLAPSNKGQAGRLELVAARLLLAAEAWTDVIACMNISGDPETSAMLDACRAEALDAMGHGAEALQFAAGAAGISQDTGVQLVHARLLAKNGQLDAAKAKYLALLGRTTAPSAAYARISSEYAALLDGGTAR